jgi:hypothetical protein
VNPSEVRVTDPNVGFSAAPVITTPVAEEVAFPAALVAVTVALTKNPTSELVIV